MAVENVLTLTVVRKVLRADGWKVRRLTAGMALKSSALYFILCPCEQIRLADDFMTDSDESDEE